MARHLDADTNERWTWRTEEEEEALHNRCTSVSHAYKRRCIKYGGHTGAHSDNYGYDWQQVGVVLAQRVEELEATLAEVLAHIRPQGDPGWKLNTCLVTDELLAEWTKVATNKW
jgi:hypothetical protein